MFGVVVYSLLKEVRLNLRNIAKGQLITNYKVLCTLLEIEEKHGNSKLSQLKELERYIKFSKSGHQILIEDIYEKQIEKVNQRAIGYNSKYVSDLSIQILDILAKRATTNDYNQLFFTANRLFEMTGMCNSNFSLTKKAIMEYFNENPNRMTDFDVEHFKNRTGDKLRQILDTTLKNLRDRNLIIFSYHHMVMIKKEWQVASKEEEVSIIEAKRIAVDKILTECERKELENNFREIKIPRKERMIFLKGKKSEYYSEVNSILFEENPEWERICKGLLIEFHGSMKNNVNDYKREISELTKSKFTLNGKIQNFISDDAERRYKESKRLYKQYEDEAWEKLKREGLTEREDVETKKPFKYHRNYLSNQEFLSEFMIVIKK